MTAVDAIRWLSLTDGDRDLLPAAVAEALTPRPWARAAWFYGSAARGRPARDIDIGIFAAPLPADRDFSAIAGVIANRLRLRPTDIDVRLLNGGDPVFLGNVLRDGILVFEADREQRVQFQVWAMNQWLDFRPVWERQRRRLLASWSHA